MALLATDRLIIDGFLRLLDQLEAEEARVEKTLAELSYPKEEVRLLMTLPGVGAAAAQALVAALGDWRRFPDGDVAASYLGLTPSVRQSGGSCHYGHITKAGNPQTRWLLTQAAQQVAQHPGPLGVFFRRLKAKKTHNVAVVATARKLVVIAHLMLKNREPYRYALPDTTRDKLAKLRVAATGVRRKRSGLSDEPRQPRPPGVRVRKIRALNEVYASEALPTAKALPELAAGERKALEVMGVIEHVERMQTRQVRFERKSLPKTV